jgi:hypothetical protein
MRSIALDGDIEPGEILEEIEKEITPSESFTGYLQYGRDPWPPVSDYWDNYSDVDSSSMTWTSASSDTITNYVIFSSTGATYGEVE